MVTATSPCPGSQSVHPWGVQKGLQACWSFRWHLIRFWEGKQLSTGEGLFSGQVSTGEGLVSKLVVAKGRLVSWAGYCRLWSGFHFCT